MAEHVQVQKREYASRLGDANDDTPYAEDIDYNEDHVDVRGVFIQGDSGQDEVVHLTRDASGRLTLKDSENTSPVPLTDLIGKVKVSANDTADYLLAKLAAGSRIAITELNDGGDEDAQISVSDEYQYDEDATTRSTTSTGWDLAHRLTTTALVGGTYRVGFYYTWSFSRTNRNFQARLLVDGTEEHYHEQIPTDSGSDQRAVASGFVEVSLGAGAINIDLEFSRESGPSSTSYIYVSRLEIVRVS